MATKNPLCNYGGDLKELQSGDTLPGGGGASPLTTKGDIYGYSTADARLPIGTNGQVLKADSTTATGLAWGTGGGAAIAPAMVAGRMYSGYSGDYSDGFGQSGGMYTVPYYVPVATTIDRIGIHIPTTATAGVFAQLGIYTGETEPDTLLIDAGEVDLSTTGQKIITGLALSVPVGLIWLMCKLSGTVAKIRAPSANDAPVYIQTGWTDPSGYTTPARSVRPGGTVGRTALPATFSSWTYATGGVIVLIGP